MPPQPSTFTLKTAFLSSQTRLLSTLPPPPPQWQQNLPPSSEHGDLSASVLDQVLYKLSIVARKHHHEVYSSQTLRHIAEQIDSLYYEAALGKEGEVGKEIAVLRVGVDLRLKENIEALPESYPRQDGETEEDLEMYQTLRARLKRSCDVLEGQRGKHAYYERLGKMVRRKKTRRWRMRGRGRAVGCWVY
ncbi:hypothetical protein K440DRAFT_98457 [Wilcoxina mikolae CBS 423.85]|nr:hypothetical protein K440DRAFT_98457 [Wilcoxina mikolae CBS 423.85]